MNLTKRTELRRGHRQGAVAAGCPILRNAKGGTNNLRVSFSMHKENPCHPEEAPWGPVAQRWGRPTKDLYLLLQGAPSFASRRVGLTISSCAAVVILRRSRRIPGMSAHSRSSSRNEVRDLYGSHQSPRKRCPLERRRREGSAFPPSHTEHVILRRSQRILRMPD
jgi:hypothetical protein